MMKLPESIHVATVDGNCVSVEPKIGDAIRCGINHVGRIVELILPMGAFMVQWEGKRDPYIVLAGEYFLADIEDPGKGWIFDRLQCPHRSQTGLR